MVEISNDTARVVVAALSNLGDLLERSADVRWYGVARAAALLESLRVGRIDAAKFANRAPFVVVALEGVQDSMLKFSATTQLVIALSIVVFDALRLGLAELVSMPEDAIFAPPARSNPMLETAYVH